jgi:uncharacterized protein (DUF2249 family)
MTIKEEIDLRGVKDAEQGAVVVRRLDAIAAGDVIEVTVGQPPYALFGELQAARRNAYRWQMVDVGPEQYVVRLLKQSPP